MEASGQKIEKNRYLIAYLLDDLPVGVNFQPTALHITVLPWFTLETEEAPFIKWFYEHFSEIEAFDATAQQRVMFGAHQDVPVTIMSPKDKFMRLHKLALSWFGDVGASWAERDPYVGDDYIPHIAQRRGFVIEPGQKLRINSLTLFKARPRRVEDQVRTVIAKAILDEPT